MAVTNFRTDQHRIFSGLAIALVLLVSGAIGVVAQSKREFSVSGRKYTYRVSGGDGADVRVKEGDLVTIHFSVEDIPHSFSVTDDHYRIDRRAEPDKPVTFRFRADKTGTFEIRCILTIDERCLREMRGRLIVEPR